MKNVVYLALLFVPFVISCTQEECETDQIVLEIIQGEWTVKTAESATIKVKIEGNQGVVSDAGTSGYQNGDVIWKDIVSNSAISFNFDEIGIDGSSQNASITVVNEWIITINVNNDVRQAAKDGVRYDTLTGTWRRVESNNPANDNMLITINGTSGHITDSGNSSTFGIGEIKWKDIAPDSETTFSYYELGSDGQYYVAVMTIINDSVLNVSVGSTGAGNIQKWIRNGTGTDGPYTSQLLDCNAFSSSMTLKNGPADVDYIVDCVLDVTAPLVIEAGVVISFKENAGLGVYDNGTLNMLGTAEEPIILKGDSPVKGFWRGIHIETSSVNNQFSDVIISDAGSNYVYCCNMAASLFNKDGKIGLKNVTFANGGGVGIAASNDAQFTSFEGVVVTTHDDFPLSITMNVLNDISDPGSNFTGNVKDYIYVASTPTLEAITWSKTTVPYLVEGDVLDVKHAMVIEAGTEIAFEENGGVGVYDGGSLKITGTSDMPVILRGWEDVAGYWRGIHIETNSLSNDLQYLNIENAGSNYVYCCNEPAALYLKTGKCKLQNVSIESNSVGIYAATNFSFSGYSNISINADKEPLKIAAERASELDELSTYSSSSAAYNYIAFVNSDVKSSTLFKTNASGTPYLIAEVLDVTMPLTIEKGVELVFKSGGGLGVYDDGSISINGTADDQVVLRGYEDIPGYWRGIHTETNSINNKISNAVISNAGENYVYCCNVKSALYVKGGKLQVDNTLIQKSGDYGIYVNTGATLTEFANTFSENTGENIFYK